MYSQHIYACCGSYYSTGIMVTLVLEHTSLAECKSGKKGAMIKLKTVLLKPETDGGGGGGGEGGLQLGFV